MLIRLQVLGINDDWLDKVHGLDGEIVNGWVKLMVGSDKSRGIKHIPDILDGNVYENASKR